MGEIAQDIGGVVDEEEADYLARIQVSIIPQDPAHSGPSSIQPTDASTEGQADEEDQDLTDHE